jgi:hypothetical protein
MEGIMTRTLGVVLLLSGSLAYAKGGTAVDVKGHYYETCDCAVSCPCATTKFTPTEGHCDAVSFFHLDKASVGKTKLDGLNLAVVLKSPKGQKVLDAMSKGDMDHFAIYFDEKATEEQRKTFPDLMAALFGKMEIKNAKAPAFVAMAVDSDGENAKLTIGDKLTADIENIQVGETKFGTKTVPKHIKLEGVTPFPWMGGLTQGRSRSFHYVDGATKWDYKDRNAFFGEFAHKATVAAAETAPAPAPAPAK